MAEGGIIAQREPLHLEEAGELPVRLGLAGPATRLSLRARPDAVGVLAGALGLALPMQPKHSVSIQSRHALWLGPDEWLLIDEDQSDPPAVLAASGAVHSAVDVSHRNVGIMVAGEAAAAVLNGGCPQNLSLSAFPVGAVSRTVLGKVEIVLWRRGETMFQVECWRSFADYAWTLLRQAARDV